MPEEIPQTVPVPPPPVPSPEPALATPIPFNIGEEFGTARKNLPPVRILVICVAIIAVIAGAAAFFQRQKQMATGKIENIAMAGLSNQAEVMVAIGVSIQNQGNEPYAIREITADLEANNSSYKDNAASAVDFGRYFEALPALKEHALEPLNVDRKIRPGESVQGTIIVAFPVTEEQFNQRKSLKVTITPHKSPIPLVLTQ